MYRTLALTFLIIASGCRPLVLGYSTPEGTPDYKLGWEDGCDTGLAAEDAGYLYRAVYGYKKRPELMENPQYKDGWGEGFQYCRFTEAAQRQGSTLPDDDSGQ